VHSDIRIRDFEGKCIASRRKLKEVSQEMLPINVLATTQEVVIESNATWQILTALESNNNILNWLTLLGIITTSNKCIQNEHDSCDGTVKNVIDGSDNTQMCGCQCHNSNYQLVQKMVGVINQKE
jgi:hypothetical protein